MYIFKLPSSESNYETIFNLDGTDYIFLFHWNGRTSNWYYRIMLLDRTVVQGDKKLTNGIRVNKDSNENTPPGWLVAYMPPEQGDPGLFDLETNFEFFYITEQEVEDAV